MTDVHKIRPAGRHLLTIGKELIQDRAAAIIELVKNSYDADSPRVNICLNSNAVGSSYTVIVEDFGHGMDRETVIQKWMVPSTDDKLVRKMSPGGRTMQGSKGVGRYAASILGDDLLLETVTDNGEKTTLFVQWQDFERVDYLDEVELLVETESTKEYKGTRLTITGTGPVLGDADNYQLDKLKFELRKLISPITEKIEAEDSTDKFEIYLNTEGLIDGESEKTSEKIEPYPILNLFDYKITGKISSNGKGELTYINQKATNTTEEVIDFDYGGPTECGELYFDLRVYDRDKDAIEALIHRGLKDNGGNYVGKMQARKLLDNYNGIGVYRNGFRIRPMGDADYDWIELNKQRVINPSLKIGSNQIIGYVLIQSEENSELVEKSARDGLRDNKAFVNLKKISKEVLSLLEHRRYAYRRKVGISQSKIKVQKSLEQLFEFAGLKKQIDELVKNKALDGLVATKIIKLIDDEEENKNKLAEDIKQAVAVYQGQATLGKIINVVLHEGRRPLNYFKNQVPNLNSWVEVFDESASDKSKEKIVSISKGIMDNSNVFVNLFSRLDPLATGRRGRKKDIDLKKSIIDVFGVFRHEIEENGIKWSIDGPDGQQVMMWYQDVYTIFTNLIDNSVFWLSNKKVENPCIHIEIMVTDNKLDYIDFRDNGPGIEKSLIEDGVIFEPEFTTKDEGSGLGLSIAGEAASRNNMDLQAFESESGAYFRLQWTGGSDDN